MSNLCDVCNKDEAIGVASSTLGAISLAYCSSCNEKGAEPYGLLLGTMWMVGGYEKVAQWLKEDVIPASLAVAGKTMEEFLIDIEKYSKEMDENYNNYVENDKKRENETVDSE